jgi:hypothetical protein
MRRKIVITSCDCPCPWWRVLHGKEFCSNQNGPDKEIKDSSKIPDWCPLEEDRGDGKDGREDS